ncbi:MAG: DUF488 family protein [Betaproteobacteria bacterium]|nr:MAG: DUF488 family protein [Betaproteobacteria bacterium]
MRSKAQIRTRGARRTVRIRRAEHRPAPGEGVRVLVERQLPPGISREQAAIDLWLRDAAPSPALGSWYGHDPRRWPQFRRRYRLELMKRPEVLRLLDDLRRRTPVTLLHGARDDVHNCAVVLRECLDRKGERP